MRADSAFAIFLMLNAVTPFITPDPPWLANLPLVVLCLLRRERRDTAPARCGFETSWSGYHGLHRGCADRQVGARPLS